jgi:hypothetical protein
MLSMETLFLRKSMFGLHQARLVTNDVGMKASPSSFLENPNKTKDTATIIKIPVLPTAPNDLFQQEYNRMAATNHSERCYRYGLNYIEGTTPRRLFFGSMIADESLELLDIHATEAYSLYHVVALSESNTTHMNTQRALRFANSPAAQAWLQNLFHSTELVVHHWVSDTKLRYLEREASQRSSILQLWKRAGMTERDVGIMADLDEVWTRDFLLAAQHCQIDALEDTTCRQARISASAISFEASPYCIKRRNWFHPDMVSGACLEGVGDNADRMQAKRKHEGGRRATGYGEDGLYFENLTDAHSRYPLWNGPDMRELRGGDYNDTKLMWQSQEGTPRTRLYGTAFHFHNWFQDSATIRHKYKTYAHGYVGNAKNATLSDLELDLDVLVRCVKRMTSSRERRRVEIGYDMTRGPKPIYFLNKTYREERHALVKRIVAKDEAVYGSNYPDYRIQVE